MICRVSKDDVRACGFDPEPHTTSFGYDGDWLAYKVGDRIVSVLVVRKVAGKNIVSGCYTLPEFRGRGLMHLLVDYISHEDEVYKGQRMFAHCLISSKHIFEDCGYVYYRTVNYKHGAQHFMRLDR